MELGRGMAQHVLIVGKTGSGKSNLLHGLMTSLALAYSPDEIELYLVDFKKGVEWKPYANHRLPHARIIAIESEREFGLSVLQGLDSELQHRSDLFRSANAQNLRDYYQKSQLPMPRIVLVIDEFQELFTEDDMLSAQAVRILDRLVRQGRAFGIHLILGSQSLSGDYTLPRSTIGQIAVRIALQCSEPDTRLVLTEDNDAVRMLSRPGEAIYNAVNGLQGGNSRFQVAWLSDIEREVYLKQINELAQQREYRRNQVIFEGNTLAEIDKNRALHRLLAQAAPAHLGESVAAWIGEPIAIRQSIAAVFRRQGGSNLLIIGQNGLAAQGILASVLISCAIRLEAASDPARATFSILDLSQTDALHSDVLKRISDLLPHSSLLGRRRQLPIIIQQLAEDVQRRQATRHTLQPSRFLFIHGLQRAHEIHQLDTTEHAESQRESPSSSLAQQLTTIYVMDQRLAYIASSGAIPSTTQNGCSISLLCVSVPCGLSSA
ncbi:MAG: DNA translocase FtsK, partial [Chloroflexaceae bacterium]|nr:DNA translocase FtsK [Chloroflexaceae bacterium]